MWTTNATSVDMSAQSKKEQMRVYPLRADQLAANPSCQQHRRWGFGWQKKQCGSPATHWHPIYGETCRECAYGMMICEGHDCETPRQDVRLVQLRVPMRVNRWQPQERALCNECRKKEKGHWRYAR
jgi:hypothetical protein